MRGAATHRSHAQWSAHLRLTTAERHSRALPLRARAAAGCAAGPRPGRRVVQRIGLRHAADDGDEARCAEYLTAEATRATCRQMHTLIYNKLCNEAMADGPGRR